MNPFHPHDSSAGWVPGGNITHAKLHPTNWLCATYWLQTISSMALGFLLHSSGPWFLIYRMVLIIISVWQGCQKRLNLLSKAFSIWWPVVSSCVTAGESQSCIQEPRLKNKIWIAIWLKQRNKTNNTGSAFRKTPWSNLSSLQLCFSSWKCCQVYKPCPQAHPLLSLNGSDVSEQVGLQKALTAWLWYRCFFKGFTYWNPGPWHSDAEVTELTGSVLEEDCPRTLSSFSWDCTWPFSLTSANLMSLLPAHSDAIHFQSSPEPRWCGTTCFTSRTMSLINLFPV